MTRDEAISILKQYIDYNNPDVTDFYTMEEAIEVVIKALEQEPCADAISRQAVLDGLASIAKAKARSDAQKSLMGRVMFFTEHLPPVAANPKTGHWVFDEILDKHYYCSECKSMGVDYWDYCPNCGAKMQEVEE